MTKKLYKLTIVSLGFGLLINTIEAFSLFKSKTPSAASKTPSAATIKKQHIFTIIASGTWQSFVTFANANPTQITYKDANNNNLLHAAIQSDKPLVFLHVIQMLNTLATTKGSTATTASTPSILADIEDVVDSNTSTAKNIVTAVNTNKQTPLACAIAAKRPNVVATIALLMRVLNKTIDKTSIAACTDQNTQNFLVYVNTLTQTAASDLLEKILSTYDENGKNPATLRTSFQKAAQQVIKAAVE